MERLSSPDFLQSPIIFIEPTNGCNLACEMCPTNREMQRGKGRISQDTFMQVVDEVGDSQPFLNFWGWGEPLLHPKIFEMTRYATDKGCKVRISSNIEPLMDAKVDELIESGLFMLLVPLDGITQEAHASYRVRGNVQKVKSKIEQISRRKKELKLEKPYLTVLTLVTKQSYPELDEIEGFCRATEVDALMLKLPNLWRTSKSNENAVELYNRFIMPDADFSRYTTDVATGELTSAKGSCPFLDKNGAVLWNGDVTTCCYDHDGKHVIGNVNDPGGYEGVLNSNKKVETWELMQARELDICSTCDANGPRTKVIILNNSLSESDFLYL